jgi:uncharacterized protein YndB with AHSA1/START domain
VKIALAIALAIVAALVLGLAVLAASAKFDRPSQSSTVERVIAASREAVWAELADLDAYSEWNPYVTQASGTLRVGNEVRVVFSPPDEDAQEATVKVLTAHFERKIRFEDRLVLPGVRDEELTFHVIKLTPDRVRLVETVRMEGLLAPFADLGPATDGLELMATALAARVEASG